MSRVLGLYRSQRTLIVGCAMWVLCYAWVWVTRQDLPATFAWFTMGVLTITTAKWALDKLIQFRWGPGVGGKK